MEKTKVDLTRDSFSCSICLDLLQDPVTLACGHNYCKICVEVLWDRDEIHWDIYECPQCRRSFKERPVLQKNTVLAEFAEELKKTGPADDGLGYAGPEDVACDVCTGRKMKAIKSCLLCLVSYCEEHLQPHLGTTAFRRHKLVQPSKHLQEMICAEHDEEKKMFCRTDQLLICHLCVDQHKNHDIVSAAAQRKEREKKVGQSRGKIQDSIQKRELEVLPLQESEKKITLCADKAVKDIHETRDQLILTIQRRMSVMEQKIRSKQKTEAVRVRGLQEKLEHEISELKRKDAELQKLLLVDSDAVFLQNFPSLPEVSKDLLPATTLVQTYHCFQEVKAAVAACRHQVKDLLRDTCTDISLMLDPDPKTREQFVRYSQDITLDPNTAHSQLMFSEGDRKVTYKKTVQSPSHRPERFSTHFQVLSKETLTGPCYWEVKSTGGFLVAVSYKDISISGGESFFGQNNKSWCLCCNLLGCSFRHNKVVTRVSSVRPSAVGVYLDHSAGLLSFYSISETMTLLHRVQTTFTQPLHAGVWTESQCEFVKLK